VQKEKHIGLKKPLPWTLKEPHHHKEVLNQNLASLALRMRKAVEVVIGGKKEGAEVEEEVEKVV
jgi:hypothetical protein